MRYVTFDGAKDMISFKDKATITDEEIEYAIDNDFPVDDIPANVGEDFVTLCAALSKEELDQVNKTGNIYLQMSISKDGLTVIPRATLLEPKL